MSASFDDYRERVRGATNLQAVLAARGIHIDRALKATCPFHDDGGTPNLHVYGDHVHCFSCRAHADVFGIVEKLDRVGHFEAIRILAKDAGIAPWNPTPEQAEQARRSDRSAAMLIFAAKFYALNLTAEHRAFLRNRGVTDDQIATVGFGSANGRLVAEMRSLGFEFDEMCTPPESAATGTKWLARKSESGTVGDFFWPGLLTIPIRHRGRVVGFTARNLTGDPKFVHLPGKRTPFGLDSLHGDDSAVVVEGPFDALAVERHGYPAVALLGTGIDDGTAEHLSRFKKVYIALDGDNAGRKGMLEVATAVGVRARIAVLADGKDPDEVTKDAFDAALAASRDVVGHKLLGLPANLEPTALVSWIEDAGLIGDLAAEEDLRCDAHIEEIATKLEFTKGKTKEFRSALKKRLKGARKDIASTEIVRRQVAAQFHRFGDGRLAEVVLAPDGQSTVWAVYDPSSGRVEPEQLLEMRDHDLVPYSGADVLGWSTTDPFHPDSGRSVLLNGLPVDYGSEAELFSEVRGFITRYFNEPDENWLTLYAAYVFLTWAIEIASECPYLAWTGGAGSGKTRIMITVGALCHRPMILSAGSSAAALRRTVDRWRGTVIADEGLLNDKTDSGQAVIGIILAGFSRLTAVIQICEGENNEPRAYFTFGPKLFTGQIDFKDPGARSRTLTRALSSDNRRPGQPVLLPVEFMAEASQIRRKLQLWRFRTLAALSVNEEASSQTEPDGEEGKMLSGVPSRVQQVFLPLLRALKDAAIRQHLVTVAKSHAEDFATAKKERLESKLLQALADLMADTGGRIVRASVDGRIHLKRIRERMIGVEQAGGLDVDDAKKAVPKPTVLGRNVRSTIGLRTALDRNGSHILLENEEDLARVEAAMRNFGVEPPWPTHPADCEGCEVCEGRGRRAAPAGPNATSGKADGTNSADAAPPTNSATFTNFTSEGGADAEHGPEGSPPEEPDEPELPGNQGFEPPGPANGVPPDHLRRRRRRPSEAPPCGEVQGPGQDADSLNFPELHINHHAESRQKPDRWDTLCRAVTAMEIDGGISPPDCDAHSAAAVAACARDGEAA